MHSGLRSGLGQPLGEPGVQTCYQGDLWGFYHGPAPARRGLCSAQTRKLEAMNASILSNMAGLLVREVWGAFEHRQKQRIRQARQQGLA